MDADIAFLLVVAADYDAAGPQFAALAAGMRRIADRLAVAEVTKNVAIVTLDDIPGVRCVGFGCED